MAMLEPWGLADHFIQAMLVVLSCGLWLPVYLLAMTAGSYRCNACGKKV